MSCRVVWIDLYRAPVLTLGDCPIKIMTYSGKAQRAVSFGRSGVETDRLAGSVLGSSGALGKGLDSKNAEPVVVISNTGVGKRIIRIEPDGEVVALERLGKTGFGIAVPVVATAQVGFESFRIISAAF